jgi:hypothetical protein
MSKIKAANYKIIALMIVLVMLICIFGQLATFVRAAPNEPCGCRDEATGKCIYSEFIGPVINGPIICDCECHNSEYGGEDTGNHTGLCSKCWEKIEKDSEDETDGNDVHIICKYPECDCGCHIISNGCDCCESGECTGECCGGDGICENCEDCGKTDGEDLTEEKIPMIGPSKSLSMDPSLKLLGESPAPAESRIVNYIEKIIMPVNGVNNFREYDVTFKFGISSWVFTGEELPVDEIAGFMTNINGSVPLAKTYGMSPSNGAAVVFPIDAEKDYVYYYYRDSSNKIVITQKNAIPPSDALSGPNLLMSAPIRANAQYRSLENPNLVIPGDSTYNLSQNNGTTIRSVWVPGLVLGNPPFNQAFNDSFRGQRLYLYEIAAAPPSTTYNSVEDVIISDVLPTGFVLIEDYLEINQGNTGTIDLVGNEVMITLSGTYSQLTGLNYYEVTYRVKALKNLHPEGKVDYTGFINTESNGATVEYTSIPVSSDFDSFDLIQSIPKDGDTPADHIILPGNSISIPPLFYVRLEVETVNPADALTGSVPPYHVKTQVSKQSKLTPVFYIEETTISFTSYDCSEEVENYLSQYGVVGVNWDWSAWYKTALYEAEWIEEPTNPAALNLPATKGIVTNPTVTANTVGIYKISIRAYMTGYDFDCLSSDYEYTIIEIVNGKLIIRTIRGTQNTPENKDNVNSVNVKITTPGSSPITFQTASIINEADAITFIDRVYENVYDADKYKQGNFDVYVPYGYNAAWSDPKDAAGIGSYTTGDYIIIITVTTEKLPFYRDCSMLEVD